jgi:hypothetical protein
MELAAHQSLAELMSDWSERQSCEKLMRQKILKLSAKITNSQWLIGLHRSLMNTLKRKCPRIQPCSTVEVT